MIILVILGFLLLTALTAGLKNVREVSFLFYFKSFSHPYFRFCLNFHKEVYESFTLDVLTIGLILINLEIEFKKPLQ